jgi:hypothetical protein
MREGEELEEVWLGYQITKVQKDEFDVLVAIADDITDRDEAVRPCPADREGQIQQEKNPALEKFDRLCLHLCITLSNHESGDDEHESVLEICEYDSESMMRSMKRVELLDDRSGT